MGRNCYNSEMTEVYLTENELGYIVSGLRALQANLVDNYERYGYEDEANRQWEEVEELIVYLCEEV